MHAEIKEKLDAFARTCISDVQETKTYDDLKISVMNLEAMLGEAERQYDSDDGDYDGYLEAVDEIWGDICSVAVKKAGLLADKNQSFADDLNLTPNGMAAALRDNYLFGALAAVFAAKEDESVKELPLLAAAAFNKHSYAGYKDEIACLRMLLWAGFDPNATDSGGRTALHFMVSMKNLPGSHPRAVRLLLQAGIDPNAKNDNGDTSLCYMAGSTPWLDAHTETAWRLLGDGADPFLEADDGACAYSLWKQNQDSSDDIADLVQAIDRVKEKRLDVEDNREEYFYKLVGGKLNELIAVGETEQFAHFCGYLMASIIAKHSGKGDEYAREIMPLTLDSFDVEEAFAELKPYYDGADVIQLGKAAHDYFFKAAVPLYAKLKASMQE